MAKNKNKSILDVFSKKEVEETIEDVIINAEIKEKKNVNELADLLIELILSGALENEHLKYTQKQERIIEKCILSVLNQLGIEPSIKGIRSSNFDRSVQNALISCLPKKGK